MKQFEEQLQKDLHQFLLSMKEVDERLPQCPDVEEKWEEIAQAYIPDGIREFNDFPSASLGWMMYIGMAVAKFWDAEWEIYSKIENLYAYLRIAFCYNFYSLWPLSMVTIESNDGNDDANHHEYNNAK